MTVERRHRQGDRPRGAARDLRRPGLVGRRQAALRRRRLRRRDLRVRPRRRPALEHGQARLSRAAGRKAAGAFRPAWRVSDDGKTLWVANAFGHSVARFDPRPRRRKLVGEWSLGDDSYPYGLAWDEAKAPALREPLGQGRGRGGRYRQRQGRRPLDDGGASQRDAPGARGQGPLRRQRQPQHRLGLRHRGGQGDRDDRHGDRPRAPVGQHAELAGALARRVGAVRRQRQHQQPGRGQRQGARREHAARLHPDRLVSDLGPGLARRQDALRRQRQGGHARRPTATARTRSAAGGRTRPASTSAASSRGRSRSSRCPARREMAAYSQDGLRVQPAPEGRPDRRRPARSPRRATRSRPRSATPRRSRIASTSSRRTGPTTRSSATCPKATASPSLCLFPEAITPNHHALVREFVLLDNFYVDGEVSADGHEWTMGAYASDFVERTWPLSYRGDRRVPYPVRRGAGDRPAARAATSGTARPRRGSATAATASSSRTARRPTTRARPRSRPSRGTSTR